MKAGSILECLSVYQNNGAPKANKNDEPIKIFHALLLPNLAHITLYHGVLGFKEEADV